MSQRNEPREVTTCAYCSGEIYEGDEVARIDDGAGFVHHGWNGVGSKCSEEYAKERVYDAIGVIDVKLNVE
jgi:hypothetical protein